MKKSILNLILLVTATAFLTSNAYAQVALNMPGIKGESKLDSHSGWMDASDIQFGVTHPSTASSKAGTADINIGLGQFSEIKLNRNVDASSVTLFKYSISGSALPSATIHLLKKENNRVYTYLEILLDKVFISTYQISGNNEEANEEISIRFSKIKLRYLDSRGTELSNVGWDLISNRQWH